MLWSMRFHIKGVRLYSCDVIIIFNLHFETTTISLVTSTLAESFEFESFINVLKKEFTL